MSASVRKALDEARLLLSEIYGERLEKVVLYGSQARGEATPGSDVDVLVVLRGTVDTPAEIKRLVRVQTLLLDRYGELMVFQPFAVEEYYDGSRPLMMNVHNEGIEL